MFVIGRATGSFENIEFSIKFQINFQVMKRFQWKGS